MLVTSKFGWSANMERIMSSQAMGDSKNLEYMKGRKIMEINPDAPIVQMLKEKCTAPDAQAEQMVQLLYETGLLTSGFTVDEPTEFAKRVFTLMNVSADTTVAAPSGKPSVVEPEVFKNDDD